MFRAEVQTGKRIDHSFFHKYSLKTRPVLGPILGSGDICENTDKAPPDFICNRVKDFINKSAIKRIHVCEVSSSPDGHNVRLLFLIFNFLLWLFSISGVLQETED